MVESLSELNKICQKPRYKEQGNWMVRTFLRDAALPMTWLLLHAPITANQVTLFSLICGLLGILLLAIPAAGSFLAGALLLESWYYLDHVDGQIARYRKTDSLSGRFFDFLTHHIIHGCLFFGLGFSLYHLTGRIPFIVWGFLASLSILMFNLIHDIKYKTFFERLSTQREVRINTSEIASSPTAPRNDSFRKAFSFIHKLCEIHVAMNILLGAALLQIFLKPPWDLRFPLFFFYGLAAPFLAVTKITYLIRSRALDHEFDRTFELS